MECRSFAITRNKSFLQFEASYGERLHVVALAMEFDVAFLLLMPFGNTYPPRIHRKSKTEHKTEQLMSRKGLLESTHARLSGKRWQKRATTGRN